VSRALTPAEAIGITGTEPPLTDADIRLTVRRAYSVARAELALAGDPRARYSSWGTAGEQDGIFLACMSDGRGLWAHITDTHGARAGHIPWRTAEALLTGQGELFDLAVSA
jgi:hypothetical protein